MSQFESPRATRDFLPHDTAARREVRNRFERAVGLYGFQGVQTPHFERVELFLARSGPEIRSSLLTFHCDHEEFALRPEMTAPVCRLMATGALGNGPLPHKLHYVGSCFRYVSAKPGRYRETTQAGIESIGASGPAADAEVIAAAVRFLQSLEIDDFAVRIGTVAVFRELLPDSLGADDRATVLGHLDRLISLGEKCRRLKEASDPQLLDDIKIDRLELAGLQAESDYEGPFSIAAHPQISLDEAPERLLQEAEATYRRYWSVEDIVAEEVSDLLLRVANLRGPLGDVQEEARRLLKGTNALHALDDLATVSRQVEPVAPGKVEVVLGMARGFTFYTSTVFEISAGVNNTRYQKKYCGGGRYDRLVEEFGGPSLPAAGCAFLFDSLVERFMSEAAWRAPQAYDLYLAERTGTVTAELAATAEKLRDRGLRVGTGADVPASVTRENCASRSAAFLGLADCKQGVIKLSDGAASRELALDPDQITAHIKGAATAEVE